MFKKKLPADAGLFAACAATMSFPDSILEIENLHTVFTGGSGLVHAVNGISFAVPAGKTVAIVGESGCGKSVTSLSVMRLLPEPAGRIAAGSIRLRLDPGDEFAAVDIVKAPEAAMQAIRGKKIGMIFQEPMTSLNPVFTIGHQLDEGIALHLPGLSPAEVAERSVAMLAKVGIPRPDGIYRSYPHELSGGMRQRIMIAMALSCNPSLVIADEPTTALDVTVQAQILDLMQQLKSEIAGSILLITHDLGVVAEIADYVIVMYAGRIVEQGPTRAVLRQPLHPYTRGLLKSRPVFHGAAERLYTIPGTVPDPVNLPDCCYFKDRCSEMCGCAGKGYPPVFQVTADHAAACWRCGGEDCNGK